MWSWLCLSRSVTDSLAHCLCQYLLCFQQFYGYLSNILGLSVYDYTVSNSFYCLAYWGSHFGWFISEYISLWYLVFIDFSMHLNQFGNSSLLNFIVSLPISSYIFLTFIMITRVDREQKGYCSILIYLII